MSDYLEGDPLEIIINNPGGLGREAVIRFRMRDGNAADELDNITVDCHHQETTRRTVPLPDVIDAAPNYEISYRVDIDDDSVYDSDKHRVWPRTIHVTAKYRKTDGDTTDFRDGDPVPYFPFLILQEGDEDDPDHDCTTAADGTRIYHAKRPGQILLKTESPWVIVAPDDQTTLGRERELHVRRVSTWRANIRSHGGGREEDQPFKQWVNLPLDRDNEALPHGSLVKVEVGPFDLDEAVAGEQIYVRVTFPKRNSKRNVPRPAVWRTKQESSTLVTGAHPQPGAALCKYEFVLTIGADAEGATFYLQMGVAGGDRCTIEVGVTNTYEDDVLYIRNWRRLNVELLIPAPNLRSACSAILDNAGAALSQGLRDELAKIFSDSFIEFVYPPNGCKALAATDFKKYARGTGNDINEDATIGRPQSLSVPRNKICIVKPDDSKEALPANSSNAVSLCSRHQLNSLRGENLGDENDDTMTWTMVDFIVKRSMKNVVGRPVDDTSDVVDASDLSQTRNFYETTLEGVAESAEKTLPFHVFDYDPVDPVEVAGNFGVYSVKWRATTYKKEGTLNALPIGNGDPRSAHAQWSNPIVFTTLQERDKWCEIVNSRTVKFKLPADADDAPGQLVTFSREEPDATSASGVRTVRYTIGIDVHMEFLGVDFSTAAGARKGFALTFLWGGTVPVRSMAEIMAHEIGHICGQAYVEYDADTEEGWENRQIPGVPFGELFPPGQYYVGRGHVGAHCAVALQTAMSRAQDTDRRRVGRGSFRKPPDDDKTAYFDRISPDDHCIMWGESRLNPLRERHLCEQCKRHLHAVELTNIRKIW